jgi:hypothetical protein
MLRRLLPVVVRRQAITRGLEPIEGAVLTVSGGSFATARLLP